MPQNFVSVAGQAIGSPGYCVLSYADPVGTNDVSVSFLPTLVRITQHELAPLQKVNIALNGTVHVFQYGPQELLTWPVQFNSLPYDQQAAQYLRGRPTDGFVDLLSFIRTTLNYSQQPFTIVHPDGIVENVTYLKGLDQFQEAVGENQRAQFWTGTLTVMRVQV